MIRIIEIFFFVCEFPAKLLSRERNWVATRALLFAHVNNKRPNNNESKRSKKRNQRNHIDNELTERRFVPCIVSNCIALNVKHPLLIIIKNLSISYDLLVLSICV